MDGEHVQQPGDLAGRLDNVCRQSKGPAALVSMSLAVEVSNAAESTFAVEDGELPLPLWLVDSDRDEDAMFGNILFEFRKLVGIEQHPRIIRIRLYVLRVQMLERSCRNELGNLRLYGRF